MRACTQNCCEHRHPEISIECDDASALAPTMKWFLGWIENEVARGRRFLPEQSIEVGWSLLEIHQRTDGTLGMFEPDFKSMPAKFVDGVSNTLLHLLIQKSVAESLGLGGEIATPSMRDSAVICTNFGLTKGFIMSRVCAKAGDSGWFFGCDNPEHDHQSPDALRCVSIYEVATCHDNRVIPFLGLPPDTFVGFADGVPFFSRGEAELVIRPGSYLGQKYLQNPC
jgi:hypothetical protein